jgi:hypothetical protein
MIPFLRVYGMNGNKGIRKELNYVPKRTDFHPLFKESWFKGYRVLSSKMIIFDEYSRCSL